MQGNNDENQINNNYKNYLKPLKKTEDRDPIKTMRGKEELHGILHKLKNYYNELSKLKNSNANHLNELKKKNQDLNKQIDDKLAFTDIEFPNERISIQDYEKFKDSGETRDTIRIKIENLIIEKNKLLQKYDNEIEYGNKINNLISIERRNFDDLYEHILQTKEKISTIKVAQKNLEINKEEKIKKDKIFLKVKNDLDTELIKLEDVIGFQSKNYSNMIEELKMKNESNQKFFKEIEMKDNNLDQQHRKSSDKILSEIKKSKLIKSQNTEKESYVIKLILGLDIIKKYFIDVDKQGKEINTSELIKSEDYKTFMSEKFSIKENFESGTSQTFSTPEMNFNSMKSTNQTTNEDDRTFPGRSRISLKALKEKLDNLDLDYEKIFDFYTKIMNKTNFYHNHMINFNLKQISLESRKEHNTQRVKEIILKNSKNFEDLKKFDKKFEILFKKFENEMNTSDLFDNLKEKINDFEPSPSQHSDFYKKCRKYLSDMKTFNEFLRFNFKRMKLDCTDEELKKKLSENYKILKLNIKNEKNVSNISKTEYIRDLFKIIELDYLKENKKLEKINRAIQEYPISKLSSKDNISREKTITENIQKGTEENKEGSRVNFDMNRGKTNIEKDEYIENTFSQEEEEMKINNTQEIAKNSVNIEEYKNQIPSRNVDSINSNSSLIDVVGNTQIPSIKTGQNDIQIAKKGSKISINDNLKSDISSSVNNQIEVISGFPYISPFSGWSILKLEEEKLTTERRTENLKIQMEIGKFFEEDFNLNNLLILDVPFEKTLFYFFENTENIIENIKLSKSIVDLCYYKVKEERLKSQDLIRSFTNNINNEKNKSPIEQKKTNIPQASYNNYHNFFNLKQNNEQADYDSYSSEEEKDKKNKKNATVHMSSNINMGNNKNGTNRNRSSAPQLHDKSTNYQSEKNAKISEKLYMPFIKDKSYKIEVNHNITKIKEDSKNSAIFTHKLIKKKDEVEKIGKQLIIYNNPNINIDNISNITYNSIVKYIISHHMSSN